MVSSGDLDPFWWRCRLVRQVSGAVPQWNLALTKVAAPSSNERVAARPQSQLKFTSLPILLAHCSENSLSGAEVTVVVPGKRETHLCLHDRTGLRDPAVSAAPSAPVSAVPSEALANLFPV